MKFPSPDAPYSEIQAWYRAAAGETEPKIEHEAPPVENGPSLMCNACGKVRVGLWTPFCKTCVKEMRI